MNIDIRMARCSTASTHAAGTTLALALALALLASPAQSSNPVVLNVSIADPHIHIFEGKAYM